MAPGLETGIKFASGRLLRKGLEFGEKEFADILRVHTSLEARATVYKAWASACRNARLKAEEAGHAGKAQECAEAEQRVLRQAAEQIGTSATEKLHPAQESSQAFTTDSCQRQLQEVTIDSTRRPLQDVTANSTQRQMQEVTTDSARPQAVAAYAEHVAQQQNQAAATANAQRQLQHAPSHSAPRQLEVPAAVSSQRHQQAPSAGSVQQPMQATTTDTGQRYVQASPAVSIQQQHAQPVQSVPAVSSQQQYAQPMLSAPAVSAQQQHAQPVQYMAQASRMPLGKQHSNAEVSPKESCFSGWDIADPNLCRPRNYRPIKSPKEGDILFVREAPFKIMYKIGSGASSKVYKVLGPNLRLFALKVVTLKGNSKEMVRGFQQEFDKLRSLKDAPGVINVYSIEEFPEDKMLLMCLELGEIDLAHLLKRKRAEWQARGITDPFVADPTFICGLWHDMLRAVQSIHNSQMVHSDLKPANLVIVNGSIKIIDFGISMKCSANTTAIHRSDNTGTVNYMSPEAIANNERVGRNSDVWSLGCILYEIAYGRLPFGHITNLASKVDAIMNSKVKFPPISQGDVHDVLKRCLERDPRKRADIDELLHHQYLKAVAGGVVTHQAMFNMMTSFSRCMGVSDEEVSECCRQLQEAWNSGQNITADAIRQEVLGDRQVAAPQVHAPVEQGFQERAVLQEQHANKMISPRAETRQSQSANAYPVKSARPAPRADGGISEMDARLMAIRRANLDGDDGDTRTRL